jgi:hypothetical protein
MNLECLNGIITNNLAIHIDLTNVKSWIDFNTGLTTISLNKWTNAVSDNINLYDFGLTSFDVANGLMWEGETLTPNDTYLKMNKIGFYDILNPTTGQTSGATINTEYLPITGITATSGNYFNLNGGYLHGFFKLEDYNYTIFPARYNNGITIETVLNILPESHGIFFMMGARAEDKYNPYFSGETITGITITSGVTTSAGDYLNAFVGETITKKGFIYPEDSTEIKYSEHPQVNNIKNNMIAFELTNDKRLAYKYIDLSGFTITNTSPTPITVTGFTMIDVVFTPDYVFNSPISLECGKQRTGKLIFYVNGRANWIIYNFPEFYFHGFVNQREKQIGVPYSISWGGGSFGLEHSWHYDYQTYGLYSGEDTTYINTNFSVQENPLIGDNPLSGLVLSADTQKFDYTVFRVDYTGGTGNTYFIKFNNPISVLSNRDYTFDVSIFDDGFFRNVDSSGNSVTNLLSILAYSDTTDVNVYNAIEYSFPITVNSIQTAERLGLHPFPDEFEYIYTNGIMYYGETGEPVIDMFGNLSNYGWYANSVLTGGTVQNSLITGQNTWNNLKSVIKTSDNSGQNFINVGLLIQTSNTFNIDKPLFIKNFRYTASDILVQDLRKNDLTIEQNFNTSFIGGIQKLRIYDNALTSPEVLHNAIWESKVNENILVSKGGRIIYR